MQDVAEERKGDFQNTIIPYILIHYIDIGDSKKGFYGDYLNKYEKSLSFSCSVVFLTLLRL